MDDYLSGGGIFFPQTKGFIASQNCLLSTYFGMSTTLEKLFWEKSPSPHLQCWESCRSGHLRQKCMSVPTLCEGEGALLKFFKSEGNSQIFFPPLSQFLKRFGNFFWLENQTFHNLVFVLKVIETLILICEANSKFYRLIFVVIIMTVIVVVSVKNLPE